MISSKKEQTGCNHKGNTQYRMWNLLKKEKFSIKALMKFGLEKIKKTFKLMIDV